MIYQNITKTAALTILKNEGIDINILERYQREMFFFDKTAKTAVFTIDNNIEPLINTIPNKIKSISIENDIIHIAYEYNYTVDSQRSKFTNTIALNINQNSATLHNSITEYLITKNINQLIANKNVKSAKEILNIKNDPINEVITKMATQKWKVTINIDNTTNQNVKIEIFDKINQDKSIELSYKTTNENNQPITPLKVIWEIFPTNSPNNLKPSPLNKYNAAVFSSSKSPSLSNDPRIRKHLTIFSNGRININFYAFFSFNEKIYVTKKLHQINFENDLTYKITK